MLLLQIPGAGEIVSGLTGDYGKEQLQQNNGLFIFIIFLLITMLSLTEPLKLIFRRNIGLRSLSMLGVLAGCAVYFAWGILAGGISIGLGIWSYYLILESVKFAWILSVLSVYFLAQVYYLFKTILKILHLGMLEHYRAKANNSILWEELEYRGDSFLLNNYFESGWTKEKLWRIGEPEYIFKISAGMFFLMPVIGIPLFISSVSFWVNEWYHVYFKHERLKQSFLDMRIEMQKANLYYNQPATGNTTLKVSVEK